MSKKIKKQETEGVVTEAPYESEASLVDALMEQQGLTKLEKKPTVDEIIQADYPNYKSDNIPNLLRYVLYELVRQRIKE